MSKSFLDVQVKVLSRGLGLDLPVYKTSGSAGMDLLAACYSNMTIQPKRRLQVPCGISVAFPDDYVMQIVSRSGLVLINGVISLISPGTIDSDYRGEISVVLYNSGDREFVVNRGDRIAQAIFLPIIHANLTQVEELSQTVRGEGGFGSTGIN